jgi:tRNA-specific 2-thiouridylase
VRKIAHDFHLPNADRKDSQGICFLGKINLRTFIQRHIPLKPGDIQTLDGHTIGSHNGLALYTIGQREGIRIGGTKEPYYVVEKELSTNTLIVAEGKSNPLLYSSACILEDIVWVAPKQDFPSSYTVQIRYQQPPQSARILANKNGGLLVQFTAPQWAVTPGQLCAIYSNDICVASGIISKRVA